MPYFFHNPLLFLQLKYQNQNKLTDRHFGLSLQVNLKKKITAVPKTSNGHVELF